MQLTAMRFVLRELAGAEEQIVRDFREAVATSAADWENRSQKRAETLMNVAVLAAKNAVAAGAQAGLAAGLPAFVEATERVTRQMDARFQRFHRWGLGLLVAAATLVVGHVLTLVFLLHR